MRTGKIVGMLACFALTLVGSAQAKSSSTKAEATERLQGGLAPAEIEAALAEIVIARDRRAIPVVAELLQHRRPAIRQKAIEALAGLSSTRAESALLQALADPAPNVREAAARALGASGSQRTLKPLMEAHRRGVANALLAIGKLARPQHLGALIEQTEGDLVHSLSPAFAVMLERDDFPLRGKLQVVRAVATSKSPSAREFLVGFLERFKTNGHPRLRGELFDALKSLDTADTPKLPGGAS